MIKKYFANPRLVLLLLLGIIVVGISSYLTLPRTLNPEIKIPIVLVSTILPGANPQDVEQLVTIPLEDSIQNVANIKTLTSTSRDSVSTITIEFENGVDPDKARDDVSGRVDAVTTLPSDAQKPTVLKLDFENQPVWTFDLISTNDNGSLFKFADNLSTKLKELPEVNTVQLAGNEQQEVEITIKPQTYTTYKLSPLILSGIVQTALKSFPAGAVKTSESSFALSIDPQVVTVADIRSLQLQVGGNTLKLSDIADIAEHAKPDQGQSYIAIPNGKVSRAVTVNVLKTNASNIDNAVAAAQKVVNDEITKSNNAYTQLTVLNASDQIDRQYRELTRDFFITIVLVVVILFIFLGGRQALVSALSAPLSFLITFAVMKTTGLTLNFLSLFSLLLSLGLLVDDTVVVISAMTAYYRRGRQTPLATGVAVFHDFLIPVLSTTITTVWAFLPLLLASGIIGEFIKSIPIVVSTALIGSFFVGMFITIPLIIILLSPQLPRRVKIFLQIVMVLLIAGVFLLATPKANTFLGLILVIAVFIFFIVSLLVWRDVWTRAKGSVISRWRRSSFGHFPIGQIVGNGLISFVGIERRYKRVMLSILTSSVNRRRTIIMVVIFSLFSFLLVPFGLVKNEFFPKEDADFVYVNLELPSGTSYSKTKLETLGLLDQLKTTQQLRFVTADIGQSFSSDSGPSSGGANSVLFTLVLTEHTKRHMSSGEIAENVRNRFGSYAQGNFQVQELSGGPPAGADIQIKLLGDDLSALDTYADQVVAFLNKTQGVTNINKSIKPGTSKLVFTPDKTKLAQNQLTLDQVGLWLRTYASGFTADKNKFPGDTTDQDITLRLFPTLPSVDTIGMLAIPTQTGSSIPLTALGHITLTPNPTLITREDGKRTISVSATAVKGYNVADLNKQLEKFATDQLNLPQGYSWKTGGVNQQNDESVQSILQAMLLSFLLIITTMVLQFSSFRRAIIVMLVIPLSISGVFIMFSLFGIPLSFPALIGILALFGIVVKNAILVVDKIVKNEKEGMEFKEAIAQASESRLEPIALTSFCTIVGLIPITLSDPLWRGLGGAIIAGLTFSGTIMLFFIPVVYYYFFVPRRMSS